MGATPDEVGERHETQGKSLVYPLSAAHLLHHWAHHRQLFLDSLEFLLDREGGRGSRSLRFLRRRSPNQQAGENAG